MIENIEGRVVSHAISRTQLNSSSCQKHYMTFRKILAQLENSCCSICRRKVQTKQTQSISSIKMISPFEEMVLNNSVSSMIARRPSHV